MRVADDDGRRARLRRLAELGPEKVLVLFPKLDQVGQLENTGRLSQVRKDIARVLTARNAKKTA